MTTLPFLFSLFFHPSSFLKINVYSFLVTSKWGKACVCVCVYPFKCIYFSLKDVECFKHFQVGVGEREYMLEREPLNLKSISLFFTTISGSKQYSKSTLQH